MVFIVSQKASLIKGFLPQSMEGLTRQLSHVSYSCMRKYLEPLWRCMFLWRCECVCWCNRVVGWRVCVTKRPGYQIYMSLCTQQTMPGMWNLKCLCQYFINISVGSKKVASTGWCTAQQHIPSLSTTCKCNKV